MANASNWNPCRPVSSGEATVQLSYVEGSIVWRTSSGDLVRMEVVDDGTNSGTYVIKLTGQSADNQVP